VGAEALSLALKRPGREADHSPPSSAEVKIAWSYTATPKSAFMALFSVEAQRQLPLPLPKRKREVGRPRHRKTDNIKMDVNEKRCKRVAGLYQDPVEGYFENVIETSSYIRRGESLHEFRDSFL
jgi:hypothetical protein